MGDKVLGDNLVRGEVKDALHGTGSSLLDLGDDLVHSGRLLELDGKIDDGNVRGGDAESHTCQLSVQGRDDLANGFGGSGGGRDNVGGGSAATTPVLAAAGGTVDGELGGGHGMHGGHETLGDAEVVVDDLGQRGKAVRGARGVGDNVLTSVVCVVNAHDEHGSVILRGRGDDNLLAAVTCHMGGSLLLVGEDTSGLADVMGACICFKTIR